MDFSYLNGYPKKRFWIQHRLILIKSQSVYSTNNLMSIHKLTKKLRMIGTVRLRNEEAAGWSRWMGRSQVREKHKKPNTV